jgi:hypothetical protein
LGLLGLIWVSGLVFGLNLDFFSHLKKNISIFFGPICWPKLEWK